MKVLGADWGEGEGMGAGEEDFRLGGLAKRDFAWRKQ
jgi:hypothetical protein